MDVKITITGHEFPEYERTIKTEEKNIFCRTYASSFLMDCIKEKRQSLCSLTEDCICSVSMTYKGCTLARGEITLNRRKNIFRIKTW